MLNEGASSAFRGQIDPEELFHRIFGDRGFKMSGFDDYDEFVDSDYGFATASHVSFIDCLMLHCVFFSFNRVGKNWTVFEC